MILDPEKHMTLPCGHVAMRGMPADACAFCAWPDVRLEPDGTVRLAGLPVVNKDSIDQAKRVLAELETLYYGKALTEDETESLRRERDDVQARMRELVEAARMYLGDDAHHHLHCETRKRRHAAICTCGLHRLYDTLENAGGD